MFRTVEVALSLECPKNEGFKAQKVWIVSLKGTVGFLGVLYFLLLLMFSDSDSKPPHDNGMPLLSGKLYKVGEI